MHSLCPAGSPGAVSPFIYWWETVRTPAAVRALEHRIRRDGKKIHESKGQHDGFHLNSTNPIKEKGVLLSITPLRDS